MPLLAYIERLGTLQGLPVALVLSGGGITGEAMADLNRRVVDAGGDIVESVEVWTERPNEPRHGLSDPEAIMRRAGAVITTNARSRRGELTPGDLDAMLTDALEQTFPASDPVSLRFDSPRRRGRSISAAR